MFWAMYNLPLVAVVGRSNVGKSTLFNRLTSERLAIVENVPGVTRDRIYAQSSWNGRSFLVVDTGGITDSRDSMAKQITDQSLLAANEADVVVFLVNVRDGLVAMDQIAAEQLRRVKKPVILVANKAEQLHEAAADFYPLGLGQALPISAEHGLGIGDLLDLVVSSLPDQAEADTPVGLAIAVVGRPNVGKSTLVNTLLGKERMITSDQPGTTRDAIDSPLIYGEQPLTLIDTAGIRRAAKIDEPVEYYSVLRAIRAAERSDVVLLMLLASDPATIQDKRIAGIAHQAGRACLILINKWDTVTGEDRDQGEFTAKVRDELKFLDYAPVLFISARTGLGVNRILPVVMEIAAEHARKIPTARLNEVLNEAVLMHEPPSYKGRKLRLYYATQVHTKPPIIQLHVNDPGLVHFSYHRYLENQFRQAFGLKGTPLILRFKPRERDRQK